MGCFPACTKRSVETSRHALFIFACNSGLESFSSHGGSFSTHSFFKAPTIFSFSKSSRRGKPGQLLLPELLMLLSLSLLPSTTPLELLSLLLRLRSSSHGFASTTVSSYRATKKAFSFATFGKPLRNLKASFAYTIPGYNDTTVPTEAGSLKNTPSSFSTPSDGFTVFLFVVLVSEISPVLPIKSKPIVVSCV